MIIILGTVEMSVLSGEDRQNGSERDNLMEISNPGFRKDELRNSTGLTTLPDYPVDSTDGAGRAHISETIPGVTVLKKNQFIVSATVHMVDT